MKVVAHDYGCVELDAVDSHCSSQPFHGDSVQNIVWHQEVHPFDRSIRDMKDEVWILNSYIS